MKGIGNIERKERQPVTRGIKNCRDSRLFKGCSPLKLLCNLIEIAAIGNFSYRQTVTVH